MEPSTVTHSHPSRSAATGLPQSPLVVGRAFLLGMVLLLLVGYLAYCAFNFGLLRFEDADAKRVKERQKILADRLGEDAKWLHGAPSWSSKDKGLVRVPIEEAMRLTVAELAAVSPHPAEPIAANPPAPSASPASPVSMSAAAEPAAQPVGSPAPTPSAPAAAPTPAGGAPVPLPGSTPEPTVPASAAASPAVTSPAVPAPLATPAASPAPAPAGATPSLSPTEPGASPAGSP